MTTAPPSTAPVATFHATGSPPTPLTWAQREMWEIVRRTAPHDYVTNLGRVVEMPRRKIGVEQATAAVGRLLERHEALRILIRGGDDPRQEVLATGGCRLTVLEVTAEQARAEARPLMERMRTVRFEPGDELPVRFGLIVADGLVHFMTIAASHCSLDGYAMDQVVRDLRLLLLRGSLPAPAGTGLTELVARQQAGGRVPTEQALAHWREGLLRVPATTFAEHGRPSEPRYRYPVLISTAALGAARLLAARTRTSTSTVLLTAVCEAVAEISDSRTCGVLLQSNNRFRVDCATAVAPVTQLGLLVVDLAGPGSFVENVERTGRAAALAYRRAYYDPVAMAALELEVVGLGGAATASLACFNDVRSGTDDDALGAPPDPEQIRAAVGSTVGYEMETPGMCAFPFYLELHHAPKAIKIMLIADAHRIPVPRIEAVLQGCERRLVAAVTT